MAKQTWINAGGTWKKVKSAWANVDGIWKNDAMPKGVVSGGYKEFMSYGNDIIVRVDDASVSEFLTLTKDMVVKDRFFPSPMSHGRLLKSDGESFYAIDTTSRGSTIRFNYNGDVIWVFKDASHKFTGYTVDRLKNVHQYKYRSYSERYINYQKINKNGSIVMSEYGPSDSAYQGRNFTYVRHDDCIYNYYERSVYKFDLYGKRVWDGYVLGGSPYAIGIGYAGSNRYLENDDSLITFSSTGKKIATFYKSDLGLPIDTSLRIFYAKDAIYITYLDVVLKYDTELNLLWEKIGIGYKNKSIIADPSGNVFVADDRLKVHKLNSSGGLEWSSDKLRSGIYDRIAGFTLREVGDYSAFPEQW